MLELLRLINGLHQKYNQSKRDPRFREGIGYVLLSPEDYYNLEDYFISQPPHKTCGVIDLENKKMNYRGDLQIIATPFIRNNNPELVIKIS